MSVQSSSTASEIIPFSFDITDNNIGLQDNVTAKLTIQSVSDNRVIIDQPSMATITITDDERMCVCMIINDYYYHYNSFLLIILVVFVGFDRSDYTFDETVDTASVTVVLSGDIAKIIQLRVRGGQSV